VDGVDFPVVYTSLHDSPDLVINWIEIWTVWRPQIWRNEVWCFSTQNLHILTRTFTPVFLTHSVDYDENFILITEQDFRFSQLLKLFAILSLFQFLPGI